MNRSQRKPGPPPEMIEALQCDLRLPLTGPAEEAIYDYGEQLHRTHSASQATFQRLLTVLGNRAAVEITGLRGY